MSSPIRKLPAQKFQSQKDLLKLKRSALNSHFRKKVDDLADTAARPRLAAFLPQNILPWIKGYFKYAFNRKHPFAAYPAQGEKGVYRLKAGSAGHSIKVSIVGDWGSGTEEAFRVAAAMSSFAPDYTIHLGDVYYVGDTEEVEENCLGKDVDEYKGVTWPSGAVGSFSLNGNHEMYANGTAYFDTFLPTLGIPSSQDRKQLASFFCLENEHWRILGLDTGYNSCGLPVLGQIPLINQIPWVGADCRLEKQLIAWLREQVNPKARRLATILLTHHQSFSAFDQSYPVPGRQLAEFFAGQEIIWLWAHEHRMAVYERFTDKNNITAYSRCLGHGGMPVEIKTVKNRNAPLQYFDARTYANYGGTKVGYNGFLNVKLHGASAHFDYRDLNNQSILQEEFTVVSDGSISQAFTAVDPHLSRGGHAPAKPPKAVGV
jgi:calcineurin-like phosphoesterase family protein